LRFADTRGAEVGDMVLAIGNPFGVGQTVTGGIISALARTDVGISDFSFFVQTDAAINPGNSGGALVDMKGDLVGINTAIFSRGGGSNGIGFAIPSEMVRRVVEDAITDGKIVRPWLGLSGQVVTAEIAKTLALPKPQGVLISDVFPGGPAEKAGLRRGDVVTAVDNQIVFDDQGVRYVAATKRPGDPVRVDYLRQNKKLSVNASVAAPPESPKRDRRELKGESPFDGAVVINLSPAVADELGIDLLKRGVMVLEIRKGGGAARFGLKPGDLVLEVNGAKVNSAADLDAIGQTPVPVWRVAIERAGKRIEGEIRF
jgi:S1-C subfamily serine protease